MHCGCNDILRYNSGMFRRLMARPYCASGCAGGDCVKGVRQRASVLREGATVLRVARPVEASRRAGFKTRNI